VLPAQAAMLIPVGIILYTVAGGLKATFMSSYIHTGAAPLLYSSSLVQSQCRHMPEHPVAC
jgi:predicted neutral ceramidase superfamily lipid hydrolase